MGGTIEFLGGSAVLPDISGTFVLNFNLRIFLWDILWSFQSGGTNLERFLPKNQHTQRKLLNFENWISGGLRSFQKDF